MSSPVPTDPRILRFPRSDETGSFVLVHVSCTGPAPLDLSLMATEGESPYVSLVKQACLKDLHAKNYQGSNDEWIKTVSLILGQCSTPPDRPDWATGLEASASISGSNEDNKEIVITIRKRVQNITQRLGAFTLKQDDEQAVELFEWTGITAVRAHTLEQQVFSLTSRYRFAEDTIRRLNEQLEELVHAKTEHENRLVASFVQVLNEKKLKIRNQQRLLASSTVDPTKVSEMQASIPGESHEIAEKSRSTKRSASKMSDTDDSDGFEQMDIDPMKTDRGTSNNQDLDDEGPSTSHSLDNEPSNSTTDDYSSQDETPPLKRVSPKTDSTQPRKDAEETEGETDDDEL
ncbi:DNA double-strand break repair and VJ recombination XRCC4 [Penicillium digitatum]|uniref:DNA double-strand break repair and VJ recombination XRCC4 n=1 Tax=Penicillium digitatum TaxID=36651 RepID=A0A7T6XKN9_PENDI|nr:DNA double-strand break repair and VJ recombination XRCC4 [Penicillium digitatum]